jgi:hypothetical protein
VACSITQWHRHCVRLRHASVAPALAHKRPRLPAGARRGVAGRRPGGGPHLAEPLKDLQHAGVHALEATQVENGLAVLHGAQEGVRIFLNLVLWAGAGAGVGRLGVGGRGLQGVGFEGGGEVPQGARQGRSAVWLAAQH